MATIWDNNGRVVFKTNTKRVIDFILDGADLIEQNGAYKFTDDYGFNFQKLDFYMELHIYKGYYMVV